MRTLMFLAFIKGLVMSAVAFAVTGNTLDTLIIAVVSAFISGMFLIANSILQHTLVRRDLVERQEQIIDKVDDLRKTVEDAAPND